MSNTKISALNNGTPVQASDVIPIARGGANYSLTGISLNAPLQSVVGFSAAPTFNGANGNSFQITLTADVTSSTFSNPITGQIYVFEIIQDSSGGHNFVWPANVLGGVSFTGSVIAVNAILIQLFYFDGTNAYAIMPGSVN